MREDGRRFYATPEPKDMVLFVAGGLGGLHADRAAQLRSSLTQTKPIAAPLPAEKTQAAE